MVTVLIDFLMEILIIEDGLFYKVSGVRFPVFALSSYAAASRVNRYSCWHLASGCWSMAPGSWLSVSCPRLKASSQKRVARGQGTDKLNLVRRAEALAKAGENKIL
jgi:hypothetical protein